MRDKQFGHRTEGITREGLRNIPGVTFEQLGDDNLNGSASKLRRVVFWIGAAALLTGIYVGTRGSGQGLSQYWKTNGGTVADEIYVPIGAKDVFLGQANKTCSSRGDATGGGPVRKASTYSGLPRGREPEKAMPGHAPHAFHRGDTELLSLQAQIRETTIRTDPHVAAALKAVIANGHIPRRDIIAAGPSDLEAALRGAEPARSAADATLDPVTRP